MKASLPVGKAQARFGLPQSLGEVPSLVAALRRLSHSATAAVQPRRLGPVEALSLGHFFQAGGDAAAGTTLFTKEDVWGFSCKFGAKGSEAEAVLGGRGWLAGWLLRVSIYENFYTRGAVWRGEQQTTYFSTTGHVAQGRFSRLSCLPLPFPSPVYYMVGSGGHRLGMGRGGGDPLC